MRKLVFAALAALALAGCHAVRYDAGRPRLAAPLRADGPLLAVGLPGRRPVDLDAACPRASPGSTTKRRSCSGSRRSSRSGSGRPGAWWWSAPRGRPRGTSRPPRRAEVRDETPARRRGPRARHPRRLLHLPLRAPLVLPEAGAPREQLAPRRSSAVPSRPARGPARGDLPLGRRGRSRTRSPFVNFLGQALTAVGGLIVLAPLQAPGVGAHHGARHLRPRGRRPRLRAR